MWHQAESIAESRFLPVDEFKNFVIRHQMMFNVLITEPEQVLVHSWQVDNLVASFKEARAIYGDMSVKNWRGQPQHPIDEHCYFQTTDAERARMIELFDHLVDGDKDKYQKLVELIDRVWTEKLNSYEFDRNEE